MAINRINNGDSGSIVRAIINAVIDAVNGFTSTISSIITRVEYVEKISVKTIIPLIGEQDGSNVNFTTAESYTLGSSELYVNGIRLFIGLDYLELDQDNIEFKSIIPEPEDVIVFECVLKY